MRRNDREINAIEELEEIIGKCDVCRIAFANGDIPYIVTMNFGYSGGEERKLFFHCAGAGRKLEMAGKNNYVCFQMDTDHELYGGEQGCDWGMKFRSITGYGNLSIIKDKTEKVQALDCLMAHYAGRKKFSYNENVLENTIVLELKISEMTGKKK